MLRKWLFDKPQTKYHKTKAYDLQVGYTPFVLFAEDRVDLVVFLYV